MPRSRKIASMDVEELFLDPDKVVSILEAGKTISLIDDDGKIFARVEPVPEEQKTKPKKKPRKTS